MSPCNTQLGGVCTSVPSTSGVTHDSSPPFSTAVRVVSTPAAPIDTQQPEPPVYYQTDATAIHASWVAFTDPHTAPVSLEVGLGTSGFGTNIIEFQSLPVAATSISLTPAAPATEFDSGLAYYVVFRTVNTAGARGLSRLSPVVIDKSPPAFDWVVDVFPVEVAGLDTHFTDDNSLGDVDLTDASAVRAKFRCTDPQSATNGFVDITYEWRVCNTALCDDVVFQDWVATGETPRGDADGSMFAAALAAGTLSDIFVNARCTNGAGLSTIAASDGASFDLTPADVSSAGVLDLDPNGGTDAGDIDWLNGDILDVAWFGFTTALGSPSIVGYNFAVGSAPGLADIAPFTPAGLSSTASTNVVQGVPDGVVVYVTVQAVTSAGAISSVSSDGVGIDRVSPEPTVTDITGPFVATDTRRCAPHLTCIDLSSAPPGSATDISFVASPNALSFAMVSRTGTAPLATLGYGASSCDPAEALHLNVVPLHLAANPADTSATMDNLFLRHGQEVCIVVFTTSVTGAGGFGVSNGVVVDLTAPVPHLVHEGPSDLVDDDVVGVLDSVTLTVSCSDSDSGIHHAEVSLSRVAFSSGTVLDTPLPWTPIAGSSQPASSSGTPVTTTLTGLSLTMGEFYVTSLRCVNNAGATSTRDSDGFFVDTSPPDAAAARVQHSLHDLVVTAQTESGLLQASWTGFVDVESDVVGFAWAIGTTPSGENVLSRTDLGPVSSAEAAIDLQDGATYFVTVFATNGAGLAAAVTSAGVTVDSTAPPPVTDVELAADTDNDGVAWVVSGSIVTASWAGVADPHTDVTYRWSIGTTQHGQQVLPWTPVGTATSATASALQLIPGMRYYATVESTNEAGLRTHVASGALAIDPLAPRPGRVANGPSLSNPIRFQTSTTTLECAWGEFVDTLSGVESFHVGFGSAVGAADTVAFSVQPATVSTFAASGLSLLSGTTYFCTVVAYDEVGNSVSVSSMGVVVDNTPPIAGAVLDSAPSAMLQGLGNLDLDNLVAPSALAASWPGWDDPESGIVHVEWALGTSAGGTDVLPWTTVSQPLSFATFDITAAGVDIAAGLMVYASVRMQNAVGLSTTLTSDGTLVHAAPDASATTDLIVEAQVLLIPAAPTSNPTDRDWCSCGDADGAAAASGAVFDPVSGSCSCGPGSFLDAATGLCAPCPAGTCKPAIGNAESLCDAALCGDPDEVIPTPPPQASSLPPCGDPALGRVVHPDDSSCVCPAGTYTSGSAAQCVTCASGTVNPLLGNINDCGVCGEATVPDAILHVSWNDYATQTGQSLSSIVVSVGTSPAAMRWQQVLSPTATHAQFSSRDSDAPPFYHGSQLWVRVRMEVASVRRRLATGDPIVIADERVSVDVSLSPPMPGTVLDGPSLVDSDVQGSGETIAASWFGFSGQDLTYEVAFGTSAFSADVLDFVNVGTALQHTSSANPALADGTVVFATVRATGADGAWAWESSDGVLVQSVIADGVVAIVSPAAAAVAVSGAHEPALTDASGIATVWQVDNPSGLTFEWSLVDLDTLDGSGEPSLVFDFVPMGHASFAVAQVDGDASPNAVQLPSPLLAGHRYVAQVRAANAAGVQRILESPPTIMDVTVPGAPTVILTAGTEPSPLHANPTFRTATSVMEVQWQCNDGDTPATYVLVSVGSVADGSQVHDRTPYAVGSSPLTLTELELHHGQCYTAQVQCSSESSSSQTAKSAPVCIDTTAPAAGVTIVHPLVAAATSGTATPVDVVLQATSVDANSEDVTADHVALIASFALEHAQMSADPVVHVSPSLDLPAVLHVAAFDGGSGVSFVDLAWSTEGGGSDDDAVDMHAVVPRTPVSLTRFDLLGQGSASAGVRFADIAAAVTTGTPVFAHYRVWNGAGSVTRATSTTSVRFDGTPPQQLVPISLPTVQPWSDSLQWSWAYTDEESGMLGYTWDVVDSAGVVVVPVTFAGQATSASASGLSLLHGHTYTVRVTACNNALVCRTDDAAVTIDATPPIPGTIYLGSPSAALEADLCGAVDRTAGAPCMMGPPSTVTGTAVSSLGQVSWGSFSDAESGVASYQLILGTVPFGSQLGGPVQVPSSTLTMPLASLMTSPGADVQLVNGTSVYLSVTAVNALGDTSDITALLVHVDGVPPLVHSVNVAGVPAVPSVDASPSVGQDMGTSLVTQSNTSTTTIMWEADADAVEFAVALVDEQGGVAAGPYVVAGAIRNVTFQGLSLAPSTLYIAEVKAFDAAGNVGVSRSGTRLVVDITPPKQLGVHAGLTVGVVNDGLVAGSDVDCQTRGIPAPSSGGEHLEVTVIDLVARDMFISNIGSLILAANITGELLEQDTEDNPANASTFNVTIDDTFYKNKTVLLMNANPFVDPESGILSVEVAVGTYQLGDDVVEWTSVGSTHLNAIELRFPKQDEGTILYASLRATNPAGLSSEATTDGIRLLCDPNTDSCQYDGTFVCI